MVVTGSKKTLDFRLSSTSKPTDTTKSPAVDTCGSAQTHKPRASDSTGRSTAVKMRKISIMDKVDLSSTYHPSAAFSTPNPKTNKTKVSKVPKKPTKSSQTNVTRRTTRSHTKKVGDSK